jgi:hypothetical protein
MLVQVRGSIKALCVVDAWLEAVMFVLKVKATPNLWPDESTCAGTPLTSNENVLFESDTRMLRIPFAYLKAAFERLWIENVVWVGADEISRRSGHNYLTAFADLLAKRVLFTTPGKDATVWEAFA